MILYNMERYSEYKNSGVKWLGEIPSHWETQLLKYCCSLKGRIGWNGLKSDEFENYSYAYLVTGQDFEGAIIDWSKCYQINQKRYEEDPYIQLRNGDILITKDGSIGKVAKVTGLDKPACLNSGIFVIKQLLHLFDQNFLYWMLNSSVLKEFNRFTQTGATIAHLYQNVFEQMPCLIPPIEEQLLIGVYLDEATSKIDVAISQQQKMIDLLNERKQIIINNAVTKGLDPNVKMKDSGIDWIGDIPEHWEVKRLKHVCQAFGRIGFRGYSTTDLVDEGEGCITLSPSNMRDGKMQYNKCTYLSWEKYEESPEIKIFNGDILFVKTGSTYGKCSLVQNLPLEATINPQLLVFKKFSCYNEFLAYVLQTNVIKTQVELSVIGGTIPTISQQKILNYVFPHPPINEQKAIVQSIENKCAPINEAIKVSDKQISLLQERKQIIINEVVTGKIKVY